MVNSEFVSLVFLKPCDFGLVRIEAFEFHVGCTLSFEKTIVQNLVTIAIVVAKWWCGNEIDASNNNAKY